MVSPPNDVCHPPKGSQVGRVIRSALRARDYVINFPSEGRISISVLGETDDVSEIVFSRLVRRKAMNSVCPAPDEPN